jgi:hypothetical protein
LLDPENQTSIGLSAALILYGKLCHVPSSTLEVFPKALNFTTETQRIKPKMA